MEQGKNLEKLHSFSTQVLQQDLLSSLIADYSKILIRVVMNNEFESISVFLKLILMADDPTVVDDGNHIKLLSSSGES